MVVGLILRMCFVVVVGCRVVFVVVVGGYFVVVGVGWVIVVV